MVSKRLLPGPRTDERRFLFDYFRESERRRRLRVEYPLMLALAGVKSLDAEVFGVDSYFDATARNWSGFRDGVARLGISDLTSVDELQNAYAWSDNLANHYAQIFRSGHVLNFALAALAVLAALAGLVMPHAKVALVCCEFAVLSLLLLNTTIGTSQQWHRRWLDYRYLAECLRPIRTLKLYGLVAPVAVLSTFGQPSRWMHWYAAALWRQMGAPGGRIEAHYLAALNSLTVAEELRPQIQYHRATARRMETLGPPPAQARKLSFRRDNLRVRCIHRRSRHLPRLDVGPCDRLHGSYRGSPGARQRCLRNSCPGRLGGTASRSAKAVSQLEHLSAGLTAEMPHSFTQAAALAESVARVMLADLAEWQVTYRQRGLDIPA